LFFYLFQPGGYGTLPLIIMNATKETISGIGY
jgi:hypothetical protein